ncbi:hypothetical protein QSV08_07920 [Maribacter sp. BPC-D8]|uniref:hypothetical protein n=1 Tax=Maribacter sp. BPC-D8 TaxID=3053613 RepID=UPI002B465A5F|nr:hypothetical protein [Maribacter sp. BPC-D8]WRI31171.1 hypothetical protein QSV08_07920 [Maribacter sp. BPC-D8]
MNEHLKPIAHFLENDNLDFDEDDFIGLQYDIVDQLEDHNIGFEIITDVLELMETNPLVEFGSPGPLTHFIESFYNQNQKEYVKSLETSIKTRPAVHTLWLLNRVINGSEEARALQLTQVMKSVYENKQVATDIRNVAQQFLE